MKKLILIALLLTTKTVFAEDFQCSAVGSKIPQIPVSDEVLAIMGQACGYMEGYRDNRITRR